MMRICSGAGCLRVVAEGVRFCDECKPTVTTEQIRNHTTAYDAYLDSLRKGTRWQRVRGVIVRRDPFCCRCQIRLTELVDHIVPAGVAVQQARDSGQYPLDADAGYYIKSNLQGLCRPCHYTKTLEDKTHTGVWADVVETEAKVKRKV